MFHCAVGPGQGRGHRRLVIYCLGFPWQESRISCHSMVLGHCMAAYTAIIIIFRPFSTLEGSNNNDDSDAKMPTSTTSSKQTTFPEARIPLQPRSEGGLHFRVVSFPHLVRASTYDRRENTFALLFVSRWRGVGPPDISVMSCCPCETSR